VKLLALFSLLLLSARALPEGCRDVLAKHGLSDEAIVLYDGECGFCSKSIQFLLHHNGKRNLKFAALQSAIGQEILAAFGLERESFDTVVFLEAGKIYTKSAAALRVSRHLDRPWSAAQAFVVIPPFLRNRLYDLVAANRLRLAGGSAHCELPTAETRARFLDRDTAER
jgi:predicted DCC family thiol-disulfide oxidoreductase YuxK